MIPATLVSIHKRLPMNTYKVEVTSWGKLEVIASPICFFFQIAISLLTYVATFSGQLYFGRSYFTLFQSNYFDTAVTFSGQLFLQNSCCFSPFSEQSFFRSSYFFRIASFLERKFYRAATSWEYKVLYSNYFSEQLFRRNFLG